MRFPFIALQTCLVLLVSLLSCQYRAVDSFALDSSSHHHVGTPRRRQYPFFAATNDNNQVSTSVVELLEDYSRQSDQHEQQQDSTEDQESKVRQALVDVASQPKSSSDLSTAAAAAAAAAEDVDFQPLIGNYKVVYTLPSNPNEQPVGGKWTRKNPFLSLLGSWQHLAEPVARNSVAQGINVISLKAFFSLLRITVLLRGDAYVLSPEERETIATERQTPYGGLGERSTRIEFDPPRICLEPFGKRKNMLTIRLGPKSSVVLDTPFCNSQIRVGKGSKGSLFLFGRTADPSVNDEWRRLVAYQPLSQSKLLALCTSCTLGLGAIIFMGVQQWWKRILLAPLMMVSFASTLLVAFSSGGIEKDKPISASKSTGSS